MKAATGSPTRSRSATARLAAGLAALVAGLALVSTAFAGGATAAESSGISIVQNVTPTEGCTLLPQLTYVTQQGVSTYKLIVTAPEKPCTPINAAAVIYSMPTDGSQWPQSLKERQDFTIADAGVTEITFTKACDPEQFDVLTGASPLVISPDGAWHGPLLFPGDVGTSLQWQPDAEWRQENQCVPASTSTTTTTTTATNVPPQVLGSTTLPTGSTSSTTVATVAGISATQTPAAQTAGTRTNASASLALTGANSGAVALVGAVLVVAGLVLVLSARRRTMAPAVDAGREPHRPTWFDPDDRW